MAVASTSAQCFAQVALLHAAKVVLVFKDVVMLEAHVCRLNKWP